jgi:hypothetical protein
MSSDESDLSSDEERDTITPTIGRKSESKSKSKNKVKRESSGFNGGSSLQRTRTSMMFGAERQKSFMETQRKNVELVDGKSKTHAWTFNIHVCCDWGEDATIPFAVEVSAESMLYFGVKEVSVYVKPGTSLRSIQDRVFSALELMASKKAAAITAEHSDWKLKSKLSNTLVLNTHTYKHQDIDLSKPVEQVVFDDEHNWLDFNITMTQAREVVQSQEFKAQKCCVSCVSKCTIM